MNNVINIKIDNMRKNTLKNNLAEYELTEELSNPIKVIGIGGCGSNNVNHIYR